jgi:hypothetical protein
VACAFLAWQKEFRSNRRSGLGSPCVLSSACRLLEDWRCAPSYLIGLRKREVREKRDKSRIGTRKNKRLRVKWVARMTFSGLDRVQCSVIKLDEALVFHCQERYKLIRKFLTRMRSQYL